MQSVAVVKEPDPFRGILRVDLGVRVAEERASGRAYRLLVLQVEDEYFVRAGADHAEAYLKLQEAFFRAGLPLEQETINVVASMEIHFSRRGTERVSSVPNTKVHGRMEECLLQHDKARALLAQLVPELQIVEGDDW